MAERRMFAKTIIDSDAFLDMPISARLLYYDLSMRADDDGFVNSPKKIMRFIGATNDDMNILIMRKFILPFDNGIVVIKHWRIHNYIRKDTYTETPYKEQKAMLELDENKAYRMAVGNPPELSCDMSVDESSTQVRIGKVREGKDSLDKDREEQKVTCKQVVDLFHSICVSYPSVKALSDARRKAINARLKIYSLDDFRTVFEKAEASSFLKGANDRNWTATFDWLIKDANMAKVLDGNYDNRTGGGSPSKNSKAQELDDFYNMAANWAEGGD